MVGFGFQNVSLSSLPLGTRASFATQSNGDAKMIVFPHWNHDDLLLPVHQALSGLIGEFFSMSTLSTLCDNVKHLEFHKKYSLNLLLAKKQSTTSVCRKSSNLWTHVICWLIKSDKASAKKSIFWTKFQQQPKLLLTKSFYWNSTRFRPFSWGPRRRSNCMSYSEKLLKIIKIACLIIKRALIILLVYCMIDYHFI